MKTTIKIFLVFLAFFHNATAFAQEKVEMADTMRSEGKIYVVVAFILVIFAGLIIYLWSIDRKVGKLEKRLDNKK